MNEEQDGQNLLLVGGSVVVLLVVAGLGYLFLSDGGTEEAHPLLIEEGEAELTRKPADPFPELGTDRDELVDSPVSGNDGRDMANPVTAVPVAGDPLLVTLPPPNDTLGQISIEKYDGEGNPTGRPLKSGTPVQIPDPNWPGEKIYFRAP